jgi:hypothetical protein
MNLSSATVSTIISQKDKLKGVADSSVGCTKFEYIMQIEMLLCKS